MPASCAKALAPTIALLGWTGKPVMPETRRLAGTIWVASMPVSHENMSWRVRTAITISSSDALPARSPRPFMVHSTWRAPFNTADSELATASPRSLWQCTDHTTWSELGTRSRSWRINPPKCSGSV